MTDIIYRGFIIEKCPYATSRFPDMAWQWSSEEQDETPYQFAASPEAAKRDIDEMLDEASEDLMIDLEMSIEALAFEKDTNTL